MVSVCLEDFEYSIACRERSSLEAARRLEQIYSPKGRWPMASM
jgi:hypothetical protein